MMIQRLCFLPILALVIACIYGMVATLFKRSSLDCKLLNEIAKLAVLKSDVPVIHRISLFGDSLIVIMAYLITCEPDRDRYWAPSPNPGNPWAGSRIFPMENHPMGVHGLMGTTGYTSHFYGQTTPISRPMGMSTGSPISVWDEKPAHGPSIYRPARGPPNSDP